MSNYPSSLNDFFRAHRKAELNEIFSLITGRSNELLNYNDILKQLHTQGQSEKGLQEIPIASIIGSVGRYTDFTRDFLPRRLSDQDRWTDVHAAMFGSLGVPPIEVYKIGEAYFVKDGNHRVSVARQLGSKFIQAYVTEITTRVPLEINDDPSDLILKAEYADFLEKTNLASLLPDTDLKVTIPGMYELLYEHIQVHRYFMGIEQNHFISSEDALIHWYENVYQPILKAIQNLGILRDFPGRTGTDLYLWIMKYRSELEKELGWQVNANTLVSVYASKFGKRARNIWERIKARMINLITPDPLESGPAVGNWRRRQASTPPLRERLFENILVSIRDNESSWMALDQALLFAQKENAQLYGLHINPDQEDTTSNENIAQTFETACLQADIKGSIAFEQGAIAQRIIERSIWADLVVVGLSHPPEAQALAKLRSGLHMLIHRLGMPLLVVPDRPRNIQHALLAYDGSPKSEEALYIASYLASHWKIGLTVVSVLESNKVTKRVQQRARSYLASYQVQAKYILGQGEVSDIILNTAQQENCDLILIGGYGYSPVLEVVLGSTLDCLLWNNKLPLLICR